MNDSIVILGINASHDASACILVDGRVVAAIAEERLTRVKHQHGFPARALDYCLQAGGLALDRVTSVVLNQPPSMEADRRLRQRGYAGPLIVNPSHHLLHAHYAWGASGFDDTAILVVDGSGYSYAEHQRQGSPMLGAAPPYLDMEEAESTYLVRNGRMELVSKRWALWEACDDYCRFASLGHLYSMASQYIFGHWKHAGKTMGLAPYGDASQIPGRFVNLDGPEIRIRTDWVEDLPPRSQHPAHLDATCRNLAAKVQGELERAMLHIARELHQRTGSPRLCISGGVGLNSVTNGRILRELPYRQLFITPAASDAGICVGAALFGHHRQTGEMPHLAIRHDYHGRSYSIGEVQGAISRRATRLRAKATQDGPERAAADLAEGRIIAWFEGGSELGPRALGHRSILCDPRKAEVRDRLNETIKFREPFRPFAASVLAEHTQTYFQMPAEDPFMLIVAPIRPERRADLAGICHVDGTCRIQTVGPGQSGRFREVLEAFHRLTGTPVLLNTSFNVRGEPIVESPDDALDCFLASNIDVLYIEGLRLTKVHPEQVAHPDSLVPHLSGGLGLMITVASQDGRALGAEHYVQTRTGHRARLTPLEWACLSAIDGVKSLRTLMDQAGAQAFELPLFEDLRRRGLLSFGLGGSRLHDEVYIEPWNDRFIVYAPLRNLAFSVNEAGAGFLQRLADGITQVPEAFKNLHAFVDALGLTGEASEGPASGPAGAFAPTSVYLLLTSACNLRCQYCFSSGGEAAVHLSREAALAAIDLVVSNAARQGRPAKIRFHGGGEPTLRWELLTEATAHARAEAGKHGVEVRISLNTNGLLDESKLAWVAGNVDAIYLSFDGPAHVQDIQRPARSGGSSCEAVLQTMRSLTLAGRSFAIRATVTLESSPYLSDLVDLVAPYRVSGIELEPMTLCGRGYEGGCHAPGAEAFIQHFLIARDRAQGLGIKLGYSGLHLDGIAPTYCGAAGRTFAVAPTGAATLCHRVCDPAQPGASDFIFGGYETETGRFHFREAILAKAAGLHCDASPACTTCFAKWNCGGGCYAQNQEEGGQMLLTKKNERCTITRSLTLAELARRIDAIPQNLSFTPT